MWVALEMRDVNYLLQLLQQHNDTAASVEQREQHQHVTDLLKEAEYAPTEYQADDDAALHEWAPEEREHYDEYPI